jgi:hypothetical protein
MLAGVLLAGGASGLVRAQPPAPAPAAAIFTCTTADGRKLTSDRPIGECMSREQRVLNSDGSVRRIIPPTLTAEERAEQEARERRIQTERLAQQDAVRRDRNLVSRYPDLVAHNRAREAALDTVRVAMKNSEARMRELANERKPLLEESEFYKNRRLPAKLRQQIEANDAAVEAQHSAVQTQEAELARINRLFDAELERLRRLWSGAAPGSLGPLPIAASGPALSRASSSKAR